MTEMKPGARDVVSGTLIIAAVVAAFWLIIRWHDVVFLLFVAIVISTAIKPVVEILQRRGLSRPAGIITVYATVTAFMVLIVVSSAPFMVGQIGRISSAIPSAYRDAREDMLQTPNLFIWRLGLALPDRLPLSGQASATNGEQEQAGADEEANEASAMTGVRDSLRRLTPVARAVLGLLVMFVLAFYWTVESDHLKQAGLLLLPLDRRESARELIATIEAQLGRYVVGQGLLMVSIALLSLMGYLILGLPYAFLLAIVAGLMEAIPLVGPALGAIPAALVAYSVNPQLVIWVIAFTLVLQQVENSILVPRVMRRSVGVHPLVTLLALSALGTLFGITGAIVAVPLAAILQYLFNRFFVERQRDLDAAPEGRDLRSVVHYDAQDLVHDLRRQARTLHETSVGESDVLIDELETIAIELRELLSNGASGLSEAAPEA